jgi:hypothetical protein
MRLGLVLIRKELLLAEVRLVAMLLRLPESVTGLKTQMT